jgi:hypothetical protein
MGHFAEYQQRNRVSMSEEFLSMRKEASDFIDELFDKPFQRTEIPISDQERADIKANHGVHDYREYELHDGTTPSTMTVYKRNHAYEIHHTHPSGVSGEIISTGKPNPRFVATMLHHAKELIDAGHAVRIVGRNDNGMFDHYHRIGKSLARKNDYVMSRPVSHENSSPSEDVHKFSEFLISKNIHECGNVSHFIIHNGDRSGVTRDIARATTFYGKL